MSCIWLGYGKVLEACAIMGRCQQTTGRPAETTCPHGGDGSKCAFIKAKISESNEVQ